MTTPPPDLPDEPELPDAAQVPPLPDEMDLPQVPAAPDSTAVPSRYDSRTLIYTTVATVVVIAIATAVFQPIAIVVPVLLIVSLFFIRRDASKKRRSIVTGLILGFGIGLLVSAGICIGILSRTSGA